MDRTQNICAVVAISTRVAYPYGDILQYDKADLMLEGFTLDPSGLNCSVAVLTWVSVHSFMLLRCLKETTSLVA